MLRVISFAIAALLVAGCAAGTRSGAELETIRFETTACHGRCPVLTVEVSSDGKAMFEGRAHTAVTGRRDFTVTPAQFADYRQRLAPFRPAGERLLDAAHCPGPVATDMPSIDVTWSGVGRPDRLVLYLGCDPDKNADLFDVVGRAPEALGITHWVRGD